MASGAGLGNYPLQRWVESHRPPESRQPKMSPSRCLPAPDDMTEYEFREIEHWLDDALRVFESNREAFSTSDRISYENLLAARKELHDLRLDEEV